MFTKPNNVDDNEYKSLRYLNLFRLLLSLFFISTLFKHINDAFGFSNTLGLAKIITSLYLFFSMMTWLGSFIFKEHSKSIGLIALIVDLPSIIVIALLFDGLNEGWVILPVITIGSFSILSRKPYAILAMPFAASILLFVVPYIIGIGYSRIELSSILLYSLTYFAIALVGIRQSQTYTQTLLLTQKQKTRITDLAKVNKLIIDQMQSGVVAFDNDYNIILINNKAKELIQVSRKQNLPSFLIKKIISLTKQSHNNMSLYGEDVLIDLIKNEKNSDLSLLFIEEQKRINEKSQQINLATMGQLSATVAHELRNPMASIYQASELLNESPDLNEEDKMLAGIVVKQVERSNKIIEDILLMSKPHIPNTEKIKLFDKLQNFKYDFCEQNNYKSDKINIDFEDELLEIDFDNTHLNQLLWNLTENAFKHGDGEQMSIVVSNQARSILIDFKNSGQTFEPIVEESLFTPFFTTHTQGTGLGLYICREMCKSNDAKLEYLRLEFQHVFRIHVRK